MTTGQMQLLEEMRKFSDQSREITIKKNEVIENYLRKNKKYSSGLSFLYGGLTLKIDKATLNEFTGEIRYNCVRDDTKHSHTVWTFSEEEIAYYTHLTDEKSYLKYYDDKIEEAKCNKEKYCSDYVAKHRKYPDGMKLEYHLATIVSAFLNDFSGEIWYVLSREGCWFTSIIAERDIRVEPKNDVVFEIEEKE